MQTEEKRENIEEKKDERMEMPVSGALERGLGKAPVSGAEISVHDTENDTHQKMFTFLQSRVPVMRRQLQS